MAHIRLDDLVTSRYLTSFEAPDKLEGGTIETHDVRGFVVVDENQAHDLVVPFCPAPEQDCYLLYLTFRTGDQWCRHQGLMRSIGLYQNCNIAAHDARIIRKHYTTARELERRPGPLNAAFSPDVVMIQGEGNQDIALAVEWLGFYDALETIEVRAIRSTPPIWWKF